MFRKKLKLLCILFLFCRGCNRYEWHLEGILWSRLSAYDVKTGNKIYSVPIDKQLIERIENEYGEEGEYICPNRFYDPAGYHRHSGLVSQNGQWALVMYFVCYRDVWAWDYCVFDVFRTNKGRNKEHNRRRVEVEGIVSAYPAVSDTGEYVAFLRDRTELYCVNTKTKEENYVMDVPEKDFAGCETHIHWKDKQNLIMCYESKSTTVAEKMTISIDIKNRKMQRLIDSRRILFVPDYGFYNDEGINIFKGVRNKVKQLPPQLKELIVQKWVHAVSPCRQWVAYLVPKLGVLGLGILGGPHYPIILERVTGEKKQLLWSGCEKHMRWTRSFRVGGLSQGRREEE